MFKPEYIVVHHSLTADNVTLSDIEAIRKYHIETNGWSDIAYHFVVDSIKNTVEKSYTELLIGRPINIKGSHCIGYNHNSLGVCVIGNFDLVAPSEEILNVLVNRFIKPYMDVFYIPVANVKGHRELTGFDRTCPGSKFNLDDLRGRLQ